MCGLCIYDTFTFACKQAKLGLDSLNFATLCFVTVEMTYMEKTSIKSQTLKVNKLKKFKKYTDYFKKFYMKLKHFTSKKLAK